MIDANSQFFAILTNVGLAKQANADALGIPWKITDMGLGDANMTDPIPNPAQTALINEWRRRPLNQLKIDPANPAIIIAEQIIPADEGGRWIREIGLYDEAGDLVAVANCAPSYKPLLSQGSGRTQVVRMNFIVNNAGNMTLKIDPSVVLAARSYVDTVILEVLPANKVAGSYTKVTINDRGVVQSGSNPTTLAGYGITLASQAEAEAGTDTGKPMSPLRVFQAIAKVVVQATEAAFGWAKVATQVQADAGADDATFITPKKMRFGVLMSLTANGYVVFPSWLGGFAIQWGSGNSADKAAVSFPLGFPSTCFVVLASDGTLLASPWDQVSAFGVAPDTVTKNGFNLRSYFNVSSNYFWLALGK